MVNELKKEKRVNCSITLGEKTVAELKKACKKTGYSKSALIEFAIKRLLSEAQSQQS